MHEVEGVGRVTRLPTPPRGPGRESDSCSPRTSRETSRGVSPGLRPREIQVGAGRDRLADACLPQRLPMIAWSGRPRWKRWYRGESRSTWGRRRRQLWSVESVTIVGVPHGLSCCASPRRSVAGGRGRQAWRRTGVGPTGAGRSCGATDLGGAGQASMDRSSRRTRSRNRRSSGR